MDKTLTINKKDYEQWIKLGGKLPVKFPNVYKLGMGKPFGKYSTICGKVSR